MLSAMVVIVVLHLSGGQQVVPARAARRNNLLESFPDFPTLRTSWQEICRFSPEEQDFPSCVPAQSNDRRFPAFPMTTTQVGHACIWERFLDRGLHGAA